MKTGRPLKEIDGEEVRRLASIGCTYREIGARFDCDESTVRRRFASEFEQGKENGKTSLRHMQWKRARAGSDTMLIHLGKNYLGQSDKVEQTTRAEPPVIVLPEKDLTGEGYAEPDRTAH